MYKIPSSAKQFVQPNNSNCEGNLYATFNCDFSENEGRIRVGKRLPLNTSSIDTSDIGGLPVAFKLYGGSVGTPNIYGIAGTNVVVGAASYPSAVSFSRVASSPTTSATLSDMEIYSGDLSGSSLGAGLMVTTDTNLWHFDGTTWTSRSAGLGAGTPHMMCDFRGRLYVTTANSKVWSLSNATLATSGQFTIDLTNSISNNITFIKAATRRIWIGTQDVRGGKGYVYEWDGTSDTPTNTYRLRSNGALSCVIKDDIPYIVDAFGDLLVWNGGTFKRLTGLNRTKKKNLYLPVSTTNQRFIHPNGMTVLDNKILIMIDGKLYDNTIDLASTEETIPSGVWEYNEATNDLKHKHSVSFRHAADSVLDYGQFRISQAGAIAEVDYPSNNTSRNGRFICGANFYISSSSVTTASGIFSDDSNDTMQKAGYFITSQLDSSQVTDNWKIGFLQYKKLLSSSDRIILKYRTSDRTSIEGSVTWTSTTTFTTTVDISTVAVGDEVEIIQGLGSGKCAHITAISGSGTYTVTVDETFTSASVQKAVARFTNFRKLGTISDQTTQWKDFGLPTATMSPWIQFKVWMLFTGKNEIIGLTVQNESAIKGN